MKPLFTIITVTYNASETLPVTLRSVQEQSCRLFEYVVMDGASKDGTADLARHSGIPEIKVYSEPDSGIYDAMNKAMDRSEGEYLIFLNAGDTFHTPDTLQHLAEAIVENDYPGIVYGQTDIVDSNRNRLCERHLRAPEALTLKSFSEGMVVCHQAFCVLRKISGEYNLKYRFSADYDWCIRCLQHSRRNYYLDEVVIDYLDEGVTTANRRASLKERFSIMSRYYGLWPTLARHVKFFFRHRRRMRQEAEARQSISNSPKSR